MTFAIDTGHAENHIIPKSSGIDPGQSICLNDGLRAERLHRQIIANVEACETTEQLEEYVKGETILLDQFYMDRPEFWAFIDDTIEMQFACLKAGETKSTTVDTVPAEPGNSLGITF